MENNRPLWQSKEFWFPIALSIPYSVLGLLTLIKALEVAQVIYFQTIYRVTYGSVFHVYLTGNFLTDDFLIVAVGVVTAAALFLSKSKAKLPLLVFCSVAAFYLTLSAVATFAIQNLLMDDILVFSMFPLISALYLTFRKYPKFPKNRLSRSSLILATCGVFGAIEVLSLFGWLVYPIAPTQIYSEGWQWYGPDLETKLFSVFGLMSTVLIVLLGFSFGLKPAVKSVVDWWQRRPGKTGIQPEKASNISSLPHFLQKRWSRWLFLSFSILIVAGLSVYPYLPSINRDFQIVSVDAPYYVNQVNLIKRGGIFSESGPFGFSNERALSVLIFYGVAQLAGPQFTTQQVVAFLPLFTGILMVFATYYLVRYAFGKTSGIVLIAPLLVGFSSQFIVGFYGGFFANMLALPVALTSILFFLKYTDSKKWYNFAFFALTLTSVLLIHVYTWVFFAATLIVGLAILVTIRLSKRKTLTATSAIAYGSVGSRTSGQGQWMGIRHEIIRPYLPVALAIAANIIILVIVASIIESRSGLDYIASLTSASLDTDHFAKKWFNINYTFRVYLGGFLTNSVMILLALIWALKTDYHSNRFNVVLLSSMFISSFFFFFGETVTQSRIYYETILYIPAGIVISNILTGRYLASTSQQTRLALVILVILHLANYGVRSVANFYLQFP
jgi:hypothetical protein